MPSITDYEIFGYTPDGEIILECKEEIPCPECGKGKLIPRGRVRRHIRKEDTGEKVWYRIPYGKCDHEECGCYRRFLPDFMVPHKHYEEQAITDSLDGVINNTEKYKGQTVECPSVQTRVRWDAWLDSNTGHIECILRSVGYKVLGFGEKLLFSTTSLLEKLRCDSNDWLKIIIRFVYNSGYRLLPIWGDRIM